MSGKLVLASGSSYKRDMLQRLGIAFEQDAPDIDESRQDGEAPMSLATRLALEKALAVSERHPDAWVLGIDQVIALGDVVFSKPGTEARATEQLMQLQGQVHQLITAMSIVGGGKRATEVTVFEMKMRELTRDEAAQYVSLDQPLDCAGSYKIESAGIGLFEYCRGDDYTAIVGLACTKVRPLLKSTGFFDV